MPSDASQGPEEASSVGLIYVHDTDPGIGRRKAGKGFGYINADGKAIADARTLDRIAGLVIPPAWTEVWISPDPRGHIQATGRDQKQRKQYIYHPKWRAHRDESKYGRMAEFGRALPRLRQRVEHDLARHGLPREKVLATVVRIMEETSIRVGNDQYASTNKSFGLTTLRKRHVDVTGAGAVFEFRGKSGKMHRTGIHDRRLAGVLRRCEELPGQRLFQFTDHDGQRHAVHSHDVNDYIREASGGPFTAKDFRTWAGTLRCAQALVQAGPADSESGAKRIVAACVKEVAGALGNTPAVCRSSYIHPTVFEHYASGALAERLARPSVRQAEKALLEVLDEVTGAQTKAA
ncbi:MAG TPA: DNA topoisomerase IB [Caulobacteraceae bacterium]